MSSFDKNLNEVFPSRWIGRGSATLPAPFDWPSRSPDLTTCDNFYGAS